MPLPPTHLYTFAPYLSRRSVMRGGALLGGAAMLAGVPLGRMALARDVRQSWPNVAAMTRNYVAQGKVAQMVAALGWQQDAPDFVAEGTLAFGSMVRADADSLFRIYSMTKPITGMAAMMLIDEGVLALDQPLADILPAYGRMQVQRSYDGPITADNLEPAVRPITIRQLLTHTSGLGYGIVQSGPIAEAYRQRGLVPGVVSRMEAPGLFRGTPAASLALFADRLAEMPLVYQPGTRWSYSVSLDLLGRVIELVSGQPFDTFLQNRIFGPCGMDSTFFQVPRSQAHRLATNYFSLGGFLLPVDGGGSSIYLDKPPFPFGGAGLVSSARDYDRFLQMLAGQGMIGRQRVMSAAAVRLGTSDLMPDTIAPGGGFTNGARAFGYGAGGLVGMGDAAGLFGWFGAAGTAGLINMDNGLRHSLMTQYMPAETYPVYEEFPIAAATDALLAS